MARPELEERFRRSKLHRYLLDDEEVIVAQRQHWASFWKPIVFSVAGLFVLVILALWLPASLDSVNPFLLLAWLIFFGGWGLSRYLLWRRNWLVATNKRVMVNYGLLHQGVAMFSLSRVSDLTFTRSTFGQLLGYGELKRESASVTQTLHKVGFVEHPHATYTTICSAIFDLQDRMFRLDEDEDDGSRGGTTPQTPGLVVTSGGRGPVDPGRGSPWYDASHAVNVHYGVSRHNKRGPWRHGNDPVDPVIKDDDHPDRDDPTRN